jgi:hypothetical protein
MEMLVDGYREVIAKAESRTDTTPPTVEIDIVTEDMVKERESWSEKSLKRRRRLTRMRKVRRSGSLIKFSDDKSTQALCGEPSDSCSFRVLKSADLSFIRCSVRFFEISVLLVFVILSLRYTSAWQGIQQLRATAATV